MESVIFRADASQNIGTGHLMRCIALAQACLRSNVKPVFVLAISTPLEERLKSEGIEVIKIDSERGSDGDVEDLIKIAADHQGWICIDGYDFDDSYQKKVRDSERPLLVIDDYSHLDKYDCDILFNQNIGADDSLYRGKTDAELLLGTKYALLRNEFLNYKGQNRKIPKVASNILVTFGGSDFENATAKVIRALDGINGQKLSVQAIIGSENPNRAELEELSKSSHHSVQLAENVTDMPERMAWADLAIGAGGSTSWEFLFMGCPIITGILADNQEGIANGLGGRGLARNLGWYRDVSEGGLIQNIMEVVNSANIRKKMSEEERRDVDGRGADRVLEEMGAF